MRMSLRAQTTLAGVSLYSPSFVFEDYRGRNVETYNLRRFREAGEDIAFVQDSITFSRKGVLRGIHGDDRTPLVSARDAAGAVK